ncbi:hypothetical protein KJ608_02320, partial [Patescibacteria group bacterium]|nr:hypothetical protein [Patescibacteria group bacterium]
SALAKGYEIHVYELHLTVRAVKRELRAMARKTMEIMAMAKTLSRALGALDPLAEPEDDDDVPSDSLAALLAMFGDMGATVLPVGDLKDFLAVFVGGREDPDTDAPEVKLEEDPDLGDFGSDVPEGE